MGGRLVSPRRCRTSGPAPPLAVPVGLTGLGDQHRSLGETARSAVVVDFHLDDGEDGLAAIHHLRKACAHDMPAIIITADRSVEILQFVRDNGYPVLKKPIKPAKLRALMSHMLTEEMTPV